MSLTLVDSIQQNHNSTSESKIERKNEKVTKYNQNLLNHWCEGNEKSCGDKQCVNHRDNQLITFEGFQCLWNLRS